MKKSAIAVTVGLTLGAASLGANAALTNGSTLSISGGTFFVMEVTPNNYASAPITSHAGIVLGTSQATGAGHSGAPTGNETIATSIDNAWNFLGNTGLNFTTSPTNVLSASGNTASVDFSGWRVTWNISPSINLGSGAWNNPAAGWSGNVDGVAQVLCAVDCGNGDSYTLQYTATVPIGDPSGFGGIHYGIKLTGTVSAVPLPAAVWLLGSGLVGLVGIARRRSRRTGIIV